MKHNQPEASAPYRASETRISAAKVEEFEAVVLENERLRATFVPQLGGKMTSLTRLATGTEFLLQPQAHPLRRYSGGNFEDYDTSGFDECFPNVSAGSYPGGAFKNTDLPDHGELWSIPWKCVIRGDELCLATATRSLPAEFRKRVSLDGDTLLIKYEVASFTDAPFHYIWSSHPLLNVSPGDRILLPSDVQQTFVNWSSNSYLGDFGARCEWPKARRSDGAIEDLSTVKPRSASKAAKLFTDAVAEGCAALYHAATDESIAFHFDPRSIPYLGVWICEGGWPSERNGHLTVAIEPCCGRPDSLAEAIARRECPELLPGGLHRWELRIRLHAGVPQSLAERLTR